MTKPSDSLISGANDVVSSAFALGVSINDPTDRYATEIKISQPTRIESGKLGVDVIETYDYAGNLSHKNESIELSPSGRQLNLSVANGVKLTDEFGLRVASCL